MLNGTVELPPETPKGLRMGNLELLIQAVRARRLVAFSYHADTRIFAPHIIGDTSHGDLAVGGVQVSGGSESGLAPGVNWRIFKLEEIQGLSILDKPFATSALYNPADGKLANIRESVR